MSTKNTTLTGIVRRVVYRHPTGDWTVLELDVEGHSKSATGEVPWSPDIGQRLRLTGAWSWNPRYQKHEFKFRSCAVDIDLEPRALLAYAVSQTCGLGHAAEEAIWDRYGDKWQEQEDLDIPGLTEAARDNWRDTLRDLQQEQTRAQVLAHLMAHELPEKLAVKAWERWKEAATTLVSQNPYVLLELPRCGFLQIDNGIRQAFGIADDDPIRGNAAVLYAARTDLADGGNTVIGRKYLQRAVRDLGIPDPANRIADQVETCELQRIDSPSRGPNYALMPQADYAQAILDHFRHVPVVEPDEIIEQAPERWNDMALDESQRRAIGRALHGGDLIITGGAGTGKTTIIGAIMALLDARDESVELLAPTGKAAARLRQATGFDASTCHSWLRWTGESVMRTGDARWTTLIVDESTMCDSWLLATLLSFHPRRVILVGDEAQLQPVGAGAPFHDLLSIRWDLVVRLEHCWRAGASVHEAAQLIREGRMPPRRSSSGGETFSMVNTGEGQRTEAELLKLVLAGKFDPETDVVLTGHNGDSDTDFGSVRTLNRMLVDELTPREQGEKWKVGDRVMNLKNYGADDWYNGDTGTIAAVDYDGGLWIEVDRQRVLGSQILLDEEKRRTLTLAYTLTVHKSQGSQYRRVFFVILKRHARLLSRSLIYTGITRAREACIVLGQTGVLESGIRNRNYKRTALDLLAEIEAAEKATQETT